MGAGDEEGGDEEEEEGGEPEEEVGHCCVVADESGRMVRGGGWVCRFFGVRVCGSPGELRSRTWQSCLLKRRQLELMDGFGEGGSRCGCDALRG